MYATVPRPSPVPVSADADRLLLSPKSDRYTWSVRPGRASISMFPGLTSRCTSPAECAASKADATGEMTAATRPGASGPSRSSRPRTSPPDTYRIAMNSTPPASPASYTGMMCGSSTAAAARDSRKNRRRNSASPASPGASSFSATSRSGRSSRARNTTAIPPAPISPSRRYPAIRAPAVKAAGPPPVSPGTPSLTRPPALASGQAPGTGQGTLRMRPRHICRHANPSIRFSQTLPQPRDGRQDVAPAELLTGQG